MALHQAKKAPGLFIVDDERVQKRIHRSGIQCLGTDHSGPRSTKRGKKQLQAGVIHLKQICQKQKLISRINVIVVEERSRRQKINPETSAPAKTFPVLEPTCLLSDALVLRLGHARQLPDIRTQHHALMPIGATPEGEIQICWGDAHLGDGRISAHPRASSVVLRKTEK